MKPGGSAPSPVVTLRRCRTRLRLVLALVSISAAGAISTAGVVAHGTVEETVNDVRETLEIMMPGGGYALSPTHMLQDN